MNRPFRNPVVHRRPWAALPLILAIAWVCLALPAHAADLLVASDGSGPYADIQTAMDAAAPGDHVVLMAGIYTGLNNRDMNSESSITVRAQYPGSTVIIDLLGSAADPTFGFIIVDGTLILEGLTIRGGDHPDGGAVYVLAGTLEANGCTFIDNKADRGGAINCNGGDRVSLTDCVLANNAATIEGGAINADVYADIFLTNCTFFMNACDDGSAIFRRQEATLAMDACIVAYSKGSYTFSDYYGGALTVNDTDIWGNEGGNWTGGMGALLGTNGNISIEPEMCDPMAGNFALTIGSPCAVSASLIMGGAGQNAFQDIPVYGLRADGSGMFPTLQDALDAVPAAASLELEAGNYAGAGNHDLDFLGKLIELSSRPGPHAVLDASDLPTVSRRGIWLRGGEPVGTSIHDLTIASASVDGGGGGVYVTNGSSVELRNVRFENNEATLYGGAVAISGSSETVIDGCVFDGNLSAFDVSCDSGSLLMENVEFSSSAGASIGSVHLGAGLDGATFRNVTVADCYGISVNQVYAGPVLFDDCTLIVADDLHKTKIQDSYDVSFTNCTLRSVGAADTEIVFADDAVISFADCAFEGLGAAEPNVVALMTYFTYLDIQRTTFTDLGSDGLRGTLELRASSNAVLDACSFHHTATGVNFPNMSFRDLVIRDSLFISVGTAVRVVETNPSEIDITDTEFIACGSGVELTDCSDARLSGCGFRWTGPGMPVMLMGATVAVDTCEFHDADVAHAVGTEAGGVDAEDSQVSVTGSEFLRNDCVRGPGGIHARNTILSVDNSLFVDNRNLADGSGLVGGGAVRCSDGGSLVLTGSTLAGNTAYQGAGVFSELLDVTIADCRILDNTSLYEGGGLYLNQGTFGTLVVNDSVIAGNQSGSNGAGIYLFDGADVSIERCTLAGNGGTGGQEQLFVSGNITLDLRNCILADGADGPALDTIMPEQLQLTVACTDIHGNAGGNWTGVLAPFDGVSGNLEVEPWFCDPAAGDYHLNDGSPCAAGGNTCGVTMGALPVGCNTVSAAGDVPTIAAVALHQNHPNPFNPSTKIRFELPREAKVTLGIYDVAGRLVRELMNGQTLPMGEHGVTWNGRDNAGRDQATGMYLYRLQADSQEIVKKMALVR